MTKWQPMDSREWSENAPPVIIAVDRSADPSKKIYVVGEAQYHGEHDGWLWAGNCPTDSWGSREYPDYWIPLPEPPATLETPEKHSTEDDFQHFLSYSGLGASYQRLGRDVIDLRVAYYTGAGIDVTEPCSACAGTGEIDETLGGISTSDPYAPCPDCTPKTDGK